MSAEVSGADRCEGHSCSGEPIWYYFHSLRRHFRYSSWSTYAAWSLWCSRQFFCHSVWAFCCVCLSYGYRGLLVVVCPSRPPPSSLIVKIFCLHYCVSPSPVSLFSSLTLLISQFYSQFCFPSITLSRWSLILGYL